MVKSRGAGRIGLTKVTLEEILLYYKSLAAAPQNKLILQDECPQQDSRTSGEYYGY